MVAAAGGGRARSNVSNRPRAASPSIDGSRARVAAGRARRLREVILARFTDTGTFEAWARAHGDTHGYTPLTEATLTQIDQGITPSLPRVQGLAAATGLPFEDVARELGVDFSELPALHRLLGSGFTRIDPASLIYPTAVISVPAELTPWADPFLPEPLAPLVSRWETDDVSHLGARTRPQRQTVQLDEAAGPGYPRVPLRALLQIDRADAAPVNGRFYLIEHPGGWACCRVSSHGGTVTLHSENRDYYPPLTFSRAHVRIHGRVVAFAARVEQVVPPVPRHLSVLEQHQQALLPTSFWHTASYTEMLRHVWNRRRLSYQGLKRDVDRLHELATQFQRPGNQRRRGAALSVGSLQNHLDPARHVMPVLETIFSLSAVFGVEPRDLLRAYGVRVATPTLEPVPGDAPDPTTARLRRLREHPFGEHLEREGWDLAWLISLLRGSSADRVYHLGTANFAMAPLLLPNAFVAIDPFQRPAAEGTVDAASDAIDWARPLYLLRKKGRTGLVCAYCETTDDGGVRVIPHPRAARRTAEVLSRQDAVVLGKVTHVATLLE